MKIIHIADIHLGRKRLDGQLSDQDFADAFDSIVDTAILEKADVFVIAGDLFDRPQVEPPHLSQALRILRKLKEASIPVVAIEGNHDKAFVHSDQPTWVEHLATEELLILLKPRFDSEGAILEQWNPKTLTGAWIDISGVRFTGAGYLGAATPNKVRQIVAALDASATNVLLLHAGPDYFVGEGGGFSGSDLKEIKDKMCYLALGHIHKPMLHGGWACNPGSPENCDLNEARYGRAKDGSETGRGYALLEIDSSCEAPLISLAVLSNPRRPVHRLELDCTPFGNKLKNGVEAFVNAAVKAVHQLAPEKEAILDIRLVGKLNLNRIALDLQSASLEIKTSTGVYEVAIDPSALNIANGPGTKAGESGESISREELEKNALTSLVEEVPLWGLEDNRSDFAELLYKLKESVLHGHSEDQLTEQISSNPLVDKVMQAKAIPIPTIEAAQEEEQDS
jgi:DNA repair protein SbcD/Mre11